MEMTEDILKEVAEFLDGEDIDYVVVGGFAVLYYGTPRTTMDIDLVIRVDDEEISRFAKFLEENGFFSDEERLRKALDEGSHFTAEDRETMFRLDVKGVYNEMDRRTLENARTEEVDGVEVRYASPEDTIANKLYISRPRDLEDALSIYSRQGELDEEYLQEVCRELGVEEELAELKERASQ